MLILVPLIIIALLYCAIGYSMRALGRPDPIEVSVVLIRRVKWLRGVIFWHAIYFDSVDEEVRNSYRAQKS